METLFAFWITNWTVAHYLYMWYLLNEYYLCLHFEPKFYGYIFPQGNKYFHKFWSEILKNDAHNGEWVKYHKIEHSTRYNKLKDIIRLNNFFTSDIRETRIHSTKRACFCFSELTLALFRLTKSPIYRS